MNRNDLRAQAARYMALARWPQTVAIMDTGVDYKHAEFTPGRVVERQAFTRPYASTPGPATPHGTQVAGMAAARSPEIGIYGDARIADLRVVEDAEDGAWGLLSWHADAMNYARQAHYPVINMSWEFHRATMFAVVRDAYNDLCVVHAGGNSYRAHTGEHVAIKGRLFDPGGFIFVGALDTTHEDKADWSQTPGTAKFVSTEGDSIDFADLWCMAPGEDVRTTTTNGGYTTTAGTSFASPTVAGLVAMIMAIRPTIKPWEAGQIVLDTCDDMGDRQRFGRGRINPSRAFDRVVPKHRHPAMWRI